MRFESWKNAPILPNTTVINMKNVLFMFLADADNKTEETLPLLLK